MNIEGDIYSDAVTSPRPSSKSKCSHITQFAIQLSYLKSVTVQLNLPAISVVCVTGLPFCMKHGAEYILDLIYFVQCILMYPRFPWYRFFVFCIFVNLIFFLRESSRRTPQVGKLLSYLKRSLLNSFWSSDGIWRHWIWSALVRVMASGTKSLQEPMLTYNQWGRVTSTWR